ncbi:hypothetical protein ACF0H5_016194 [Mactra antiquata]
MTRDIMHFVLMLCLLLDSTNFSTASTTGTTTNTAGPVDPTGAASPSTTGTLPPKGDGTASTAGTTTTAAPTTTVGLGGGCTADIHCLANAVCNSTMACECDFGYKPTNQNDCEQVYTSDCSIDADCNQYVLHTDCDYNFLYCVCLHGAYDATTRTCPCPHLGEGCNLDEECTSCLVNSECTGFGISKTCECAAGYENINGACSVGLGGTCTVDSDCLTNGVCDSNNMTCVCASAYRESINNDCEEVYGADCTVDSECYPYLLNSECSQFLFWCGCATNFFDYDTTNKTCTCPTLNGNCNLNEECSTCLPNTECISGSCRCATGYEEINSTCSAVSTTPATTVHSVLDDSCVDDSDCGNTTNSICNNGICACAPGYYADAGSCPTVLGSYCTTIDNCTSQVDNSNCTNNICGCVSGYIRDGVNCAIGVNSGCNNDNECVENGYCNNGKCRCLFGYTTVNRRCTPVLGGPCRYTADCSYVDSNSACLDRKCECRGVYEIVDLFCVDSGSQTVNIELGMTIVSSCICLLLSLFY